VLASFAILISLLLGGGHDHGRDDRTVTATETMVENPTKQSPHFELKRDANVKKRFLLADVGRASGERVTR